MPTFEFDMPDGTKKRAEGQTPEDAWLNLNQVSPTDIGRGYPVATSKRTRNELRETIKDTARGFGQGVLDPIEGLIQLAEKSTGWKIAPQGLKDWADDYRKRATSTTAGQVGEVAGNIFNPAYLIPGVAATRGATLGARAIAGAAGGLAQPVEGAKTDADYWAAKGWQGLTGGLVGPIAPTIGGVLARAHTPTAHFSAHYPLTSIFGTTLGGAAGLTRATGRTLQRLRPPATGGAAAEIFSDQNEDENESGQDNRPQ